METWENYIRQFYGYKRVVLKKPPKRDNKSNCETKIIVKTQCTYVDYELPVTLMNLLFHLPFLENDWNPYRFTSIILKSYSKEKSFFGHSILIYIHNYIIFFQRKIVVWVFLFFSWPTYSIWRITLQMWFFFFLITITLQIWYTKLKILTAASQMTNSFASFESLYQHLYVEHHFIGGSFIVVQGSSSKRWAHFTCRSSLIFLVHPIVWRRGQVSSSA